jgi:antitoxin component YwqK of YwqJK toxin-antitoxin module
MPPADDGAKETTYYPNGGVKFIGAYADGEMDGEWRWYRTDGSLMRTGAFDRGRQVGIWRTYDRAGHVVKETGFSNERAKQGPRGGPS